jgi:polyisoprenoid-binding protein YceI
MRIITLALAFAFSATATADWILQQPSSIHFLTTKNIHVTETHSFKSFGGKINKFGYAKISINLNSVDTRITVRDKRMQEHLFETSKFNEAYFEADIPTAILEQANKGINSRYQLQGKISLHGEQAEGQSEVLISPNKNGTITVTSISPMLIDAESFALVSGINKLQEMVGLSSISHTVPLTFSLTFKEN